MKKTIFLAHDPGGCEAVQPVFARFLAKGRPAAFYCAGPAGALNREHAADEADIAARIEDLAAAREIVALVTGTSWGSQLENRARAFCQERGIKTLAVLDYWSNYRARFEFGSSVRYPDYYAVMDDLAKKEAIADGVPPSIIAVLGQPGLDRYVSAPRPRARENKGRVLFVSQPLSVLYGKTLGYTEFDALSDLCQLAAASGLALRVKFHPKDSVEFKSAFQDMEAQGDFSALLPEYEWVVGMSSMALLHSALMGAKTISYQPRLAAPDGCVTNKLGLTRPVGDYEGLRRELLTVRPLDDKFIEEHKKELVWLDGRSAVRVAAFAESLGGREAF
ncbi:MAG: hypothetical protein LBO03_04595 [Acidaminococcales bacterium]|jgi:hypothetical protein|nr:hypothetical protein [Acidaminococcales bacterium]